MAAHQPPVAMQPPQRQEPETHAASDFEKQAAEPEPGLVVEFWSFLKENKKWWLLPLIVSLLLLGLVSWFAASGAAPFIYTLF